MGRPYPGSVEAGAAEWNCLSSRYGWRWRALRGGVGGSGRIHQCLNRRSADCCPDRNEAAGCIRRTFCRLATVQGRGSEVEGRPGLVLDGKHPVGAVQGARRMVVDQSRAMEGVQAHGAQIGGGQCGNVNGEVGRGAGGATVGPFGRTLQFVGRVVPGTQAVCYLEGQAAGLRVAALLQGGRHIDDAEPYSVADGALQAPGVGEHPGQRVVLMASVTLIRSRSKQKRQRAAVAFVVTAMSSFTTMVGRLER